jgi:predicted small lipoprotein YifL
MSVTRALVVAAAIAALAVVAGCGRKSGLDTPYEAAVQARKDAEKAKEPLPPEPQTPVEDRPFFLDRLIQ